MDVNRQYYRVGLVSESVCGELAFFHYFPDATIYAEQQLKIYSSIFDNVEIEISLDGKAIRVYRKES